MFEWRFDTGFDKTETGFTKQFSPLKFDRVLEPLKHNKDARSTKFHSDKASNIFIYEYITRLSEWWRSPV